MFDTNTLFVRNERLLFNTLGFATEVNKYENIRRDNRSKLVDRMIVAATKKQKFELMHKISRDGEVVFDGGPQTDEEYQIIHANFMEAANAVLKKCK